MPYNQPGKNLTLGIGGNKSIRINLETQDAGLGIVSKLANRTNFTFEEVKSLVHMYANMTERDKMDINRFREILHACFDINNDVVLDRIYHVFDRSNDGEISVIEWVEGLSVLVRGTPEEITDFTYAVLNVNQDGYVDREELLLYLRNSFTAVPDVMTEAEFEEGIHDMIDIAMRKLDNDNDGVVSYQDFVNCRTRDALLMASLSPCLPSPKASAAFLATFTENYRSYSEHPWYMEEFSYLFSSTTSPLHRHHVPRGSYVEMKEEVLDVVSQFMVKWKMKLDRSKMSRYVRKRGVVKAVFSNKGAHSKSKSSKLKISQ